MLPLINAYAVPLINAHAVPLINAHAVPLINAHFMPLLNAHAVISSKARCLNFRLSFHLHLFFAYAGSEGSGSQGI